MAWRSILLEGDPTLRKKSRPVTDFGPRTAQLLDDLRDTLVKAAGAGLAAPQVGILRRVVVILHNDEIVELINPEIIKQSEEQLGEFEGCLSCPDMRGYLLRPAKVTVRAQDRTGKSFELECEGIAARAACHETDHLNGVLFIDKVDKIYTEEELDDLLEELAAQAEQAEDKPNAAGEGKA